MNDKIKRLLELKEQDSKISDEIFLIEEEIRDTLTCPHCHTNEYLETNWYKSYNNIRCTSCYLEIPQCETIEKAIETWQKVCKLLESEDGNEPR